MLLAKPPSVSLCPFVNSFRFQRGDVALQRRLTAATAGQIKKRETGGRFLRNLPQSLSDQSACAIARLLALLACLPACLAGWQCPFVNSFRFQRGDVALQRRLTAATAGQIKKRETGGRFLRNLPQSLSDQSACAIARLLALLACLPACLAGWQCPFVNSFRFQRGDVALQRRLTAAIAGRAVQCSAVLGKGARCNGTYEAKPKEMGGCEECTLGHKKKREQMKFRKKLHSFSLKPFL